MCQCPLGLIPHFYFTSLMFLVLSLMRCQCPLGLIPHFYHELRPQAKADKASCQCPLGLIPHFYLINLRRMITTYLTCQCPLGLIPHFYDVNIDNIPEIEYPVSMPSRAYTSFLQYPFKNLGFMRFPEPVFAGIYQNILTAAVFRAC